MKNACPSRFSSGEGGECELGACCRRHWSPQPPYTLSYFPACSLPASGGACLTPKNARRSRGKGTLCKGDGGRCQGRGPCSCMAPCPASGPSRCNPSQGWRSGLAALLSRNGARREVEVQTGNFLMPIGVRSNPSCHGPALV